MWTASADSTNQDQKPFKIRKKYKRLRKNSKLIGLCYFPIFLSQKRLHWSYSRLHCGFSRLQGCCQAQDPFSVMIIILILIINNFMGSAICTKKLGPPPPSWPTVPNVMLSYLILWSNESCYRMECYLILSYLTI